MRGVPTVFFICLPLLLFGQDLSIINKELKLSDSLIEPKEVRFYRNSQNTNLTTVLRIYQSESKDWKAEFHEYWSTSVKPTRLKSKKRNLKPKTEIEVVYLKLLLNHILDLPNMNEIDWKFISKGEIVKNKKKINSKGDYKEIYEFKNRTKKVILDGYNFKVQISDYKNNEFSFSNHNEYLKLYPAIDELILYSKITTILSEAFDIWKD